MKTWYYFPKIMDYIPFPGGKSGSRCYNMQLQRKNERFEKVYSQGTLTVTQIWVDRETGVNYLYHMDGYSGGLTPLLDRDGKPVISPVINGSAETD